MPDREELLADIGAATWVAKKITIVRARSAAALAALPAYDARDDVALLAS